MNQQKSLINLLLVSTAALSGYKQGAANQYKYNVQHRHSYRAENPSSPAPNSGNTTTNANTNNMNMINTTNNNNTNPANGTNNAASNTYTNSSNMTNNTQTGATHNTTSTSNNMMMGVNPSATDAAQADNTFLPAFLAALYAADEAVNLTPEATGPFALQPLEYDYDALEPYIGEETLRIHHDKLHRNYVNNLNAVLARYPEFYSYTLSELLLFPDRFNSDIQSQIVHNAGGNYNHALTWKLIGPNTQMRPTGEFAVAINKQFGSFDNLKRILTEAALSVRGTGYAWLALNPYGRMIIVTTEEQLTPIPLRSIPLLPIDMWEHAHYLDTGENRQQYVENYLSLVDWNRVGARYMAAMNVLNNVNNCNS